MTPANAPSDAPPNGGKTWHRKSVTVLLTALLMAQGGLYLSAQYHFFRFNQQKGATVLIAMAFTVVFFVLLGVYLLYAGLYLRLRPQFSLGDMLLLVPVIAIPVGWLGRELELARQQRATIEAVGGIVMYDDVPIETWWGSLIDGLAPKLGVDFFADVKQLTLSRGSDADLETIARLSNVRALCLERGKFSDAGFAQLRNHARLQQLMCMFSDFSEVTDQGVSELKGLTEMEFLALGGSRVTDAGLVHLKGLVHLTSLSLSQTQITDAGLEHLNELPNLERLFLNDTHITDEGLKHLIKHKKLRRLDLNNTLITDPELMKLQAILPNCECSAAHL
jgi:hypothetical protein